MIIWVVGATGVGKRWFIRNLCKRVPGLMPTWMIDSVDPPKFEHRNVVRWQWGRETHIRNLANDNRKVIIVRLTAKAKTHLERLKSRNGAGAHHIEEDLVVEEGHITAMCHGLNSLHQIPIVTVSTDVVDWKLVTSLLGSLKALDPPLEGC